MHFAGVPAPPLFPVHAGDHREIVGIDLVSSHKAWAHSVASVEVLAFARTKLTGHLLSLLIASREIVEDRVAEYVLACCFLSNVLAWFTDVATKLQLEIHEL